MSVVWLRARAQLRGRARVGVLLAVLVGLAGGVVLAAVAGARRTDAALPRFLAHDHTIDALVDPPDDLEPGDPLDWQARAVAALPEVATATRVATVLLSSLDRSAPTDRSRVVAVVPIDVGGSPVLGRPILVAGRLPDERRPDEAVVDEGLAAQRHLGVGSVWRVGAYPTSQLEREGWLTSAPPAGPTAELRIVGVVRRPIDLVSTVAGQDIFPYGDQGDLYLTPAYWRRAGARVAGHVFIAVALHRGRADLPRLAAEARDRFGVVSDVYPVELGGTTTDPAATNLPGLRRAIRLECGALLAFAALAALAAVLLAGQTLGRQVLLESMEYPTLRALGMTRGQLVGVALVRAAVIGGGGAAVAMATAVALSPLAPIGLARRAQPHPGVVADLAVLAPGALAVVAVVAACAAVPAWWASRSPIAAHGVVEPAPPGPPSRVAGALAAGSLPPPAAVGVRLALEPGRGRTAVPVRAAIAGAAAAVCVLTAAAVLGASLTRLVSAPAARGWTWDVTVGTFATPQQAQQARRMLDAAPAVDGYLGLLTSYLLVDSRPLVPGKRVDIMAVDRGKGPVPLRVLEGREPVGPDEIALGTTTMRALGMRLGDTLEADLEFGPSLRARVVGRVVLGAGPLNPTITPGEGAVVDSEVFRGAGLDYFPQVFLVRFNPTVDRGQAVHALRQGFPATIVSPVLHPDIENLSRVSYLPGLLAAVTALLALATIVHALASSVRRRRRDLAVLKTLGFLPRQVSAAVAWQAIIFATAAALTGIPLGVATGRWAWQLVAVQLGVPYEPIVPSLQLLAIGGGTLVAASLAAVGPGWVAGRVRPATVLRSE